MTIKKILNENNPENTIVHVVFYFKFNEKREECECVGVLVREDVNSIRVAFNAKKDETVDYLDIERSDIINIDVLSLLNIEKL